MAKVCFYACAGLYIDFLNYLGENDISLQSIKTDSLGFTAICDSRDYFFIAKSSKKFQTKVRMVNKIGIYFKIRSIFQRKGLLVAVIVFCILSYLYSEIIWNINIKTDDIQLKNEIAGQLFCNGIYAGSCYDKEVFTKAAENIMITNNSLGYITLNFYKGTLDCNVYIKENKVDYISQLSEDNIYAQKNGIITDIRVYEGFSQLQTGQSVSKGDVLVSNLYTDRHGNTYSVKTRAYIEAACEEIYSIFVPFEKDIELLTGTEEKEISVLFDNREYKLGKADLTTQNSYMKREKLEYFSVLGFHFPLTVKTVTYYHTDNKTVTKDVSVALAYGKLQLQHIISNDEKLKKEYTREYSYKLYQDGLQVSCLLNGIYEIT